MLSSRFTYVVSKHALTIALVLFILGAAGLGTAGWMYANPPTTDVTDHNDRATVESSLSTRAVVVGDTALYRPGETVENQPVYLTAATPNLTLALGTRLPSETAGSVDQRIELVYTATRNGDVFWKRTEVLDGETTREGKNVVTRATVSMPDVLDRVDGYQNELKDAATVSVSVRTDVEYHLGAYDGEFVTTTPVRSDPGWYSIRAEPASKTHSTPETHTVELGVRDDPRFFVPGALGVTFVLAGLGVVGRHYRGSGRRSLADLETEVHHERYTDWITVGQLPQQDALSAVRTDSLEGLVDVAIDTGERVIYDPNRSRYAVLRGRTRYYYDRD